MATTTINWDNYVPVNLQTTFLQGFIKRNPKPKGSTLTDFEWLEKAIVLRVIRHCNEGLQMIAQESAITIEEPDYD